MTTSILDQAIDPMAGKLQQAAFQTQDSEAPADLQGGEAFSLGDGFEAMQGLPELSRDQFQGLAGNQSDWFAQQLAEMSLTPQHQFGGGPPARGSSSVANRIIDLAHGFIGQPYVWGGLDCSGLVQRVFKAAGINLPRVSFQQANSGKRIPLKSLRPGDLVAWDLSNVHGRGADHIAIYIGNGRIIEAARPGTNVRISRLYDTSRAWGVRVLGQRGSGTGSGVSPADTNRFIVQETGGVSGRRARNKALGQHLAANAGWSGTQWRAFNALVMKESGWDNLAQNPYSTAHGIGQFLDSTWDDVGGHKTNDARLQLIYMIAYVKQRYGTPMRAIQFHNAHNWY
jgi:cell wall-associated NlpC family hydrolase